MTERTALIFCTTILLASVSVIVKVFAQTCTAAPTCGELGYAQTAEDCTGLHMLKCPFDTSIVFCGGSACDSGYIYSSCDSSKGTCDECGGLYKYTACKDGWSLSGSDCAENTCSKSSYPYTSSPSATAGTVVSCKSGTVTTYGYSSCNIGWVYSNGDCKVESCPSSYYIGSCPSGWLCHICLSGTTIYVKPYGCETGTWTGSYCELDANCSGWNTETGYATVSYDTCIGEDTGDIYYQDTECAGETNRYQDYRDHWCYDYSVLSGDLCIHENTCGD